MRVGGPEANSAGSSVMLLGGAPSRCPFARLALSTLPAQSQERQRASSPGSLQSCTLMSPARLQRPGDVGTVSDSCTPDSIAYSDDSLQAPSDPVSTRSCVHIFWLLRAHVHHEQQQP